MGISNKINWTEVSESGYQALLRGNFTEAEKYFRLAVEKGGFEQEDVHGVPFRRETRRGQSSHTSPRPSPPRHGPMGAERELSARLRGGNAGDAHDRALPAIGHGWRDNRGIERRGDGGGRLLHGVRIVQPVLARQLRQRDAQCPLKGACRPDR